MSVLRPERKGDDEKMDTDVDSSLPPYRLSAELRGHDHGVRDVAICDHSLIATCEERGKMHIFSCSPVSSPSSSASPSASRSVWNEQPVFSSPLHLSLTFVVECIRSRSGHPPLNAAHYPPATFMSGGGDKAARPFTSNGSQLEPLVGHQNAVNSISVLPDGKVVTGAWDGIVRVWDGARRAYEVVGHQHAVEVLALHDGRIISASANKALHIIQGGKVTQRIPDAHQHSIRKLIAHPLGFASAGNDGVLKVWTVDGEEMQSIDAHTGSEVKFVYGLALVQETEELVSCGEDGLVKVWKGGKLVQSIRHPGPVRAVKVMDTGDIVTACTDRVCRIWSRDERRQVGEKEQAEYEEMVSMIAASNMTAIDASSLPDESALTEPGKKEGQVLVVNAAGKGPTAYQWSSEAATWLEVGGVVGKSQKQQVDGVEYDFVTDVFVSDSHKVKLGFNRDDDPLDVADAFCALYDLPADVKSQIVAHVRPMTDEVAAAEKKRRLQEEREQASLKQVPGWRQGGAEIYAAINAKGMRERLLKGNEELKTLSAAEMKAVELLVDELADTKALHVLEWGRERTRLVLRLLHWPEEHSAPVLDMARVAMVSSAGAEALGQEPELHRLLRAQLLTRHSALLLLLFLKLYSNFIAKRKKGKTERPPNPAVDPAVAEVVTSALAAAVAAFPSPPTDRLSEAFMLLCHNVTSWIGRLGGEGERGGGDAGIQSVLMAVVDGVIAVLKAGEAAVSVKAEYYALLCIGSVAYAAKGLRSRVVEKYGKELQSMVVKGKSNDNQAVREVAADVERLYNL